MARAAVKAKQAQQAKAQPAPKARARGRRKHASGGNPNQQLFFVRMRRRAKPAYFILAFLFAVTFAFLGVGSGSNGGLDQLFSNLNFFRHHGASVSAAQKEIQEHPSAAKGYRNLASAYERKADTNGAISALQQYTIYKPKDVAAWRELGGLQLEQAQSFTQAYAADYAARQLAAPDQPFLPTGKIGSALGTNQLEQVSVTDLNTRLGSLQQKVQAAYSGAVSSYAKVTRLRPNDSSAWLQLAQTAQNSGDSKTAIQGYRRYLKLNPDTTSKAEIEALIKELSPQKSSSGK